MLVQRDERVFSILVRIFHDCTQLSINHCFSEVSAAKIALHSHSTRQICGREEERRLIREFCTQKVHDSSDENESINNPCLYIYGAPGTGKINGQSKCISYLCLSIGKTAVVTSVTTTFAVRTLHVTLNI